MGPRSHSLQPHHQRDPQKEAAHLQVSSPGEDDQWDGQVRSLVLDEDLQGLILTHTLYCRWGLKGEYLSTQPDFEQYGN